MPSVTEVFHITERAAWVDALRAGEYQTSTRGLTLAEVGFIHCSLRHQLRGVAEHLYGDVEDLVLLVIDSTRLTAPVRYEAPEPGAERYPHVFGVIPVHAVIEVVPVHRDSAGRLVLPE